MSEDTAGGWLECVFRPGYRCKKHTKASILAHKRESLSCRSWLRVTARLPTWPPYTPASFTAYMYAHIPGLRYGIHVNRRVNLYN